MKGAFGIAIRALVAGQVPDDQSLVAGSREKHIWVFERGSQRGDPATVALKGALQDELFRHVGGIGCTRINCDVEVPFKDLVLRFVGGGYLSEAPTSAPTK